MSKQFLRAYSTDESRQGEPGEPIRFVASTEGIKRDGKELKIEDWALDNFRRNPVFLWVHDYWGERPPIGRVPAVNLEAGRMLVDVVFDQEDDFARSIESKYRRGFLNAVSVGWEDTVVNEQTKNDLLDISGVPIPGDPDALMARQYKALKRIFEDDKPANKNGGEGIWPKAAVSMMRLFRLVPSISSEQWERDYYDLRRVYMQHGKEPPEFRTADDLKKLTPDLVKGLFLEGEHEFAPWLWAEFELTRQDADALQQAIAILQDISKTAIPHDADDNLEPPEVDDDADTEPEDWPAVMEQLEKINQDLQPEEEEND